MVSEGKMGLSIFQGLLAGAGKRPHLQQVQPAAYSDLGHRGRLPVVLSTVPTLCCQTGRTSLIGGNSCLSAPSSFFDGCSSWTGWSHKGNVGPP